MACQVCVMHDGKRLAGRRAGTSRAGCPVPPGSGPARRQAAGLAPVVLRRACWKKTTIAGTGSHDVAGMLAHGEDPLVESHRSEEHTSELQSLMRISYAVFCLKKKKTNQDTP